MMWKVPTQRHQTTSSFQLVFPTGVKSDRFCSNLIVWLVFAIVYYHTILKMQINHLEYDEVVYVHPRYPKYI